MVSWSFFLGYGGKFSACSSTHILVQSPLFGVFFNLKEEEFQVYSLEVTEMQKRRHVNTEARITTIGNNSLIIGNSNLIKGTAFC